MGRLSDPLWRRTIELFLLAGTNGRDGLLPSMQEMTWTCRVSEDRMIEDLQALADLTIVHETLEGWVVTHFKDRQDAATDAERVREHRKRKDTRTSNVPVTKRYAPGNDHVRELESELKIESEKSNDNTCLSPLSVAFCNATSIPELTGGPQRWFDALSDLGKAGVVPIDIETAVKEMRDKNYSIVTLRSIVNPAISAMSKRKNGKATNKPASTAIVIEPDWHP